MPIDNERRSRKDSAYSQEERDVMAVYKEEYRSQPSHELRGMVFRTKILPAIFNYWHTLGKDPQTEEGSIESIKVMAAENNLCVITNICV